MEAENTRILEFTENEYPVSSEDAPNDGELNLQSANCYPCHPKVLTYEELVMACLGGWCLLFLMLGYASGEGIEPSSSTGCSILPALTQACIMSHLAQYTME
ncbi:hypothetical protein MHYP_G00004030 [Metynnis hypsauchen]